tara:strand:- start:152 stop:373 length:222 start_codon:yes stop_codon:yes gene_type:complete
MRSFTNYDMVLLEGFENCILKKGKKPIYSFDLIIKELNKKMSFEDALDYYYFNIDWLTNKHITVIHETTKQTI